MDFKMIQLRHSLNYFKAITIASLAKGRIKKNNTIKLTKNTKIKFLVEVEVVHYLAMKEWYHQVWSRKKW